MPEGITQRRGYDAHEWLSERHFYDATGSAEPMSETMQAGFRAAILARIETPQDGQFDPQAELLDATGNGRACVLSHRVATWRRVGRAFRFTSIQW